MMKIRASKLPMVAMCPASAHPPEIERSSSSDAARLGTAVHALLNDRILGRNYSIESVAARYNVDISEVETLFSISWARWLEIEKWFPDPATCDIEGEPWRYTDYTSDIHLSGHPDIYCVHKRQLRICDFKTGRLDTDAREQLLGYALLGMNLFRGLDSFYLCAIHCRDGVIEGYQFDYAEVMDWWRDMKTELKQQKFNSGRHCGFCQHIYSCPAYRQHAAASVAIIADAPRLPNDPAEKAETLLSVMDRVKLIEEACKQARDMVRAEVDAAGGVMRCPDGRELVLTETTSKAIDWVAGRSILEAEIGDQLSRAIMVSKSAVEKIVKDAAPRGQKQKAAAKLLDRLAEVGAVREKTTRRLECKNSLTPIPAKG